MRIAFIGGGVMAEAIIQALLHKEIVTPSELVVSDISTVRCSYLGHKHGIIALQDNIRAIDGAAVIILAIQPRSLAEVMSELNGQIQSQQLILSIVAATPIAVIQKGLSHCSVVRAMPNMPAQIGEGVTVWAAATEVDESEKESVHSILGSLGKEFFVPDERYIEMSTAVSGSGPAYVFLFIEALMDAALRIGLPHDLCKELVLHTVKGSVSLLQQTGSHPAELRHRVTSPGGVTAEGLRQLEEDGIRAIIQRAVTSAYNKVMTVASGER